jgi:hypothetical protein
MPAWGWLAVAAGAPTVPGSLAVTLLRCLSWWPRTAGIKKGPGFRVPLPGRCTKAWALLPFG